MSQRTYNNASTKYIGEVFYANPHIRIHKGTMYTATLLGAAVANNGFLDILFTPTEECHIEIACGSEGKALFNVYEAPTNVTGGTTLTAYNHRRASSRVSSSVLKSAPTVTDAGTTVIQSGYIYGGTGGNSVGGLRSSRNEFIFDVAKTYLIRLQNLGGATKSMDLQLSWYEEED
jgi:hypothetical protein